jgi:hypothetical protein
LLDRHEFFDEILRFFATFHQEFDSECGSLFEILVMPIVDAAVEEGHDTFMR